MLLPSLDKDLIGYLVTFFCSTFVVNLQIKDTIISQLEAREKAKSDEEEREKEEEGRSRPSFVLIVNPLVTNELSHPYHLDESIFIFRGIRINFSFLFHFLMKIMSANRIAPGGMPHFAASHLRLFCLPMSHKNKKDARLIWVKPVLSNQ